MQVLVFDVWGDYAHFKKRYTTTSPLTYLIPPRTTISGLISAIAGLQRGEYPEYFKRDKSKIGLQLLQSVKKTRLSMNLISTKAEHLVNPPLVNYFKQHTIISFEFLKDPKYRIYLYHAETEFFENLKSLLREHKSVYTPNLGLSQLICNFRFIGEFSVEEKKSTQFINISSVLPIKSSLSNKLLTQVELEEGKNYALETLPAVMDSSRMVLEYEEVLIEKKGKTIKSIPDMYWELEDGTKIVPL
ncbi:MAG: type I-B CRISPR-associated protein Cas5b [Thermoplasmata archaeon]